MSTTINKGNEFVLKKQQFDELKEQGQLKQGATYHITDYAIASDGSEIAHGIPKEGTTGYVLTKTEDGTEWKPSEGGEGSLPPIDDANNGDVLTVVKAHGGTAIDPEQHYDKFYINCDLTFEQVEEIYNKMISVHNEKYPDDPWTDDGNWSFILYYGVTLDDQYSINFGKDYDNYGDKYIFYIGYHDESSELFFTLAKEDFQWEEGATPIYPKGWSKSLYYQETEEEIVEPISGGIYEIEAGNFGELLSVEEMENEFGYVSNDYIKDLISSELFVASESIEWKPSEGGEGTSVVANPELEGDEDVLNGIEIAGVKYKLEGGGEGGLPSTENANNGDVLTVVTKKGTPITYGQIPEKVYLNCNLTYEQVDEIYKKTLEHKGYDAQDWYDFQIFYTFTGPYYEEKIVLSKFDDQGYKIEIDSIYPEGSEYGTIERFYYCCKTSGLYDDFYNVEPLKGWSTCYSREGEFGEPTAIVGIQEITTEFVAEEPDWSDENLENSEYLKDLISFQPFLPDFEWRQGIPEGGNDGDVLTKVKTEGDIVVEINMGGVLFKMVRVSDKTPTFSEIEGGSFMTSLLPEYVTIDSQNTEDLGDGGSFNMEGFFGIASVDDYYVPAFDIFLPKAGIYFTKADEERMIELNWGNTSIVWDGLIKIPEEKLEWKPSGGLPEFTEKDNNKVLTISGGQKDSSFLDDPSKTIDKFYIDKDISIEYLQEVRQSAGVTNEQQTLMVKFNNDLAIGVTNSALNAYIYNGSYYIYQVTAWDEENGFMEGLPSDSISYYVPMYEGPVSVVKVEIWEERE